MKAILLVLASADDQTAHFIASYARDNGLPCELVTDWHKPTLNIRTDSNGTVSVAIRIGSDPLVISSIINRGVGFSRHGSTDELFVEAETLAAWWTALAAFPGPVINRPGKEGWLPIVEPITFSHLGSSFVSVEGIIGRSYPAVSSGVSVNIHRLRDGNYVGSLADCQQRLDPDELYVFMPFNADATIHILVCGSDVFDLSVADGRLSIERARLLAPLLSEASARRATFSIFVVELSGSQVYLRHGSVFPRIDQYGHVADEVHRALLRYLSQ